MEKLRMENFEWEKKCEKKLLQRYQKSKSDFFISCLVLNSSSLRRWQFSNLIIFFLDNMISEVKRWGHWGWRWCCRIGWLEADHGVQLLQGVTHNRLKIADKPIYVSVNGNTFWNKMIKLLNITYNTVKPKLTTTSKKWPPVNYGHYLKAPGWTL